MSIDRISSLSSRPAHLQDASLSFSAQDKLSETLTRGDILKGKVMRHYGDNRYGVSFGGEERVVDSAIPLKLDEVVQGRVIAVDHKVHLQRLAVKTQVGSEQKAVNGDLPSQRGMDFQAVADRFLASLAVDERTTLTRLIAESGSRETVLQSGIIVSKLGLPMQRDLVKAVNRALNSNADRAGGSAGSSYLADSGDLLNRLKGSQNEQIAVLSSAIQSIAQDLERENFVSLDSFTAGSSPNSSYLLSPGNPHSGEQDKDQNERRLGHWLLNAQNESSVGHKYLTFPVWIGSRLIDVKMSLFAQRDSNDLPRSTDAIRAHRIALSLELDRLGTVNIQVSIAESNLRVAVTTESETVADELAHNLGSFRERLTAMGWRIDEVTYATKPDEGATPLKLIAQHFVSQDSLSQLM